MKSITDLSKNDLYKAVDQLTEENQSYFLGVLEALSFAQSTHEPLESELIANPDAKCADSVSLNLSIDDV
jgi:hypothetical protein